LVESSSRFSSLIEHDLFGKPLHTFRMPQGNYFSAAAFGSR
jgi:hypothetical protein